MNETNPPKKPEPKPTPKAVLPSMGGTKVKLYPVTGQAREAELVGDLLYYTRSGRRVVCSMHSPFVKFVEIA